MVIKLLIATFLGMVIGAIMGYIGQCSTGTCPLTANPWRGSLYGGFLGLLWGLVAVSGSSPAVTSISVTEQGETSVLDLRQPSHFPELLQQYDQVLVVFKSQSCPACHQQDKILKSLMGMVEFKVPIVEVDVYQYPSLAQKYHVDFLPTLMLFENGKLKGKWIGKTEKEEIFNKIYSSSASNS